MTRALSRLCKARALIRTGCSKGIRPGRRHARGAVLCQVRGSGKLDRSASRSPLAPRQKPPPPAAAHSSQHHPEPPGVLPSPSQPSAQRKHAQARARAPRTAKKMPLYELLALGVPRLPREEVARIIQRLGRAVYDRGGVVTDVKSYGEQPLAYKIRGTSGKYDQVRVCEGGAVSLGRLRLSLSVSRARSPGTHRSTHTHNAGPHLAARLCRRPAGARRPAPRAARRRAAAQVGGREKEKRAAAAAAAPADVPRRPVVRRGAAAAGRGRGRPRGAWNRGGPAAGRVGALCRGGRAGGGSSGRRRRLVLLRSVSAGETRATKNPHAPPRPILFGSPPCFYPLMLRPLWPPLSMVSRCCLRLFFLSALRPPPPSEREKRGAPRTRARPPHAANEEISYQVIPV